MQGVFVEAKRLLTNADKVVGKLALICRQPQPEETIRFFRFPLWIVGEKLGLYSFILYFCP